MELYSALLTIKGFCHEHLSEHQNCGGCPLLDRNRAQCALIINLPALWGNFSAELTESFPTLGEENITSSEENNISSEETKP